MTKFDRKIKKMAKEFQAPDSYHNKVDEVLGTIQEEHIAAPKKKPFVKIAIVIAALCLIVTGWLSLSDSKVAEASFFADFKQTILDFFGLDKDESEEKGVESEKKEAVSKQDLMIELQEVVIDTQSIYAVVKITAPTSVEFKEGMTFDYFGFCEGGNYNASTVLPGSRGCTLLEVQKEKKNVAMYVVDISTSKEIQEGKEVTVFFQNLIASASEKNPEAIVEGMWSLSFTTAYTNSKNITVKGTDDMKYSFAGTKADIKKIKLLPLGITLVSDVSRVDTETLNTTDTSFPIHLKMIDGSEIIVADPNTEEPGLVVGGGIEQYEKKGRVYEKYVGQFKEAIDINKVIGIYISDYYVPLQEYK